MKVPGQFHENLNLSESLEQLRKEPGPQGRMRFFRRLKSADLLVPCKEDHMNVAVICTPEGESLLPAFTNREELMKGVQYWEDAAVLKLDTLKHILLDQPRTISGVVLNPFGTALILRREQLEEMDRMTETMTVRRTEYEKTIILSPLRTVPHGLKHALTELFHDWPGVGRVWLVAARKDYREQPHKLFVIEYHGDRRILFPAVAKAVEPFMKRGESFELMLAGEDLKKMVEEKAEPVYRRVLQ